MKVPSSSLQSPSLKCPSQVGLCPCRCFHVISDFINKLYVQWYSASCGCHILLTLEFFLFIYLHAFFI